MSVTEFDVRAMQDPEAALERALIDEFLGARGYNSHSVTTLPADQQKCLMEKASIYAAGRLTEVEARAHFVHELHGS